MVQTRNEGPRQDVDSQRAYRLAFSPTVASMASHQQASLPSLHLRSPSSAMLTCISTETPTSGPNGLFLASCREDHFETG